MEGRKSSLGGHESSPGIVVPVAKAPKRERGMCSVSDATVPRWASHEDLRSPTTKGWRLQHLRFGPQSLRMVCATAGGSPRRADNFEVHIFALQQNLRRGEGGVTIDRIFLPAFDTKVL